MPAGDLVQSFLDQISDLPDEAQSELFTALMARQAEQLGLDGADADL